MKLIIFTTSHIQNGQYQSYLCLCFSTVWPSNIYDNHCPLPQIKLADKQAALEKIQWEAMTSNTNVEKLQEELNSVQGEISSFMLLFDGLLKNDNGHYAEDYDISPCNLDNLPCIVSPSSPYVICCCLVSFLFLWLL